MRYVRNTTAGGQNSSDGPREQAGGVLGRSREGSQSEAVREAMVLLFQAVVPAENSPWTAASREFPWTCQSLLLESSRSVIWDEMCQLY